MTGLLVALLASVNACGEGENDMALMDGVRAADVGGPGLLVPAAPAPATADAGGLGKPVVIFTFNADKDGQREIEGPHTITATISAVNTTGQAAAGPIVGIVEWGSGNSAQFAAEVDVPCAANMSGAAPDNLLAGSGVIVTVPGDYIRISARNDSNLLASVAANEQPLGDPSLLTFVSAGAGVGNRAGSSKLFLTRMAAFRTAGGIAMGVSAFLRIPPFAKAVQVIRFNAAQGVSVSMDGPSFLTLDGPINIAPNAPSPSIPIPNATTTLQLTNTGPGALLVLGAIFEIGL